MVRSRIIVVLNNIIGDQKYEYIKILKAFPHQKTNAYLSGLVKLNHKIKTEGSKKYELLTQLQQIPSFFSKANWALCLASRCV